MTNFAQIQAKIDRGLGKAAGHIGQPYSAYRLAATSSGDFPGGWENVANDVSIWRRVRGLKDLELGITKSDIFCEIVADMSDFLVGDTFVLSDPAYESGVSYGPGATSIVGSTEQVNAMTLCWHPPVRGDKKSTATSGAVISDLIRIFRPATGPATLADGSQYWKSMHDGDQALVLAAGAVAFQPSPVAGSLFPGGFTVSFRPGGMVPFRPTPPPGMLPESRYWCYFPPLPGYEPREGDAIITRDDQRYVIQEPYKQEIGLVGNMVLCWRTSSQGG